MFWVEIFRMCVEPQYLHKPICSLNKHQQKKLEALGTQWQMPLYTFLSIICRGIECFTLLLKMYLPWWIVLQSLERAILELKRGKCNNYWKSRLYCIFSSKVRKKLSSDLICNQVHFIIRYYEQKMSEKEIWDEWNIH